MTPPLGWIRPEDRTPSQWDAHDDAIDQMPHTFSIVGHSDNGPYVNLMELWSHTQVVQKLGFAFPGVRQVTGSCVGAGGGNVLFSLVGVEILKMGDSEELIVPFWLYPYGKSRELLGDKSEGEGSLGSTFAQACKQFGVFGNHESGLPTPQNSDGLVWGRESEMKWSNGFAAPRQWVDLAKRFLVQTVTPLKSSQEAAAALKNGYPVTFASNNYMTPGAERVQGSGENAACVGALTTYGPHQTSLQAVWDHPSLGTLFWNENQWARNTYKACPKVGRSSGCWMTARDLDNAIRSLSAEVFAFSQYQGYPAQTLNWGDALRNF